MGQGAVNDYRRAGAPEFGISDWKLQVTDPVLPNKPFLLLTWLHGLGYAQHPSPAIVEMWQMVFSNYNVLVLSVLSPAAAFGPCGTKAGNILWHFGCKCAKPDMPQGVDKAWCVAKYGILDDSFAFAFTVLVKRLIHEWKVSRSILAGESMGGLGVLLQGGYRSTPVDVFWALASYGTGSPNDLCGGPSDREKVSRQSFLRRIIRIVEPSDSPHRPVLFFVHCAADKLSPEVEVRGFEDFLDRNEKRANPSFGSDPLFQTAVRHISIPVELFAGISKSNFHAVGHRIAYAVDVESNWRFFGGPLNQQLASLRTPIAHERCLRLHEKTSNIGE